MLPKAILHPSIQNEVWLAFVRGNFDVAVFLAMKQVDGALRSACEGGDEMLGDALVTLAFKPNGGILTDTTRPRSEIEACQLLFKGVLGSYKNPQSHRHVNISDPAEAIELVLLANHLLRIIDTRSAALTTSPS